MSSPGNVQLTAEQRARIEQNRRQALERLKARNLKPQISSHSENVLKILPSKAVASSHRVNPYLKPSSSANNNKPFTAAINQTKIHSTKQELISKPAVSTVKTIQCTCEGTSETRFTVKTNGYDDRVIQEFKKIPSKIYHGSTRAWSFNYEHYNQLLKSLIALKFVEVKRLPEFFLKTMQEQSEMPDEAVLEQIEQSLVSTLIDFQRTGVCYGISKKGRCMIADDMGLGKSRQAIGIADFYRDDWPLLIITNASTRQFWSQEIERLLPYLTFHDVHIVQGPRDSFDHAKVVICSYNNLQGSIEDLQRIRFGVIIFDESHNLKNQKAKQTLNAEAIANKATRIIMVTGTPALSRPVELYTQLKMLDKSFATYHQFSERYCNGQQTNFGWNASGSSNLEELNLLLRKKFMIRRIKSDVFLELGAKNRELVVLDHYEYTSAYDDEMEELRNEYQDASKRNRDTEEILIKWYQTTSQVKAFGCCTYVKKYLEENDCKILVFAHHGFMMNALSAELEKAGYQFIRIDGSVRGDIRAQRVESFQTNPLIRVAVLSIRACNAGITLTAASTVIFCELDWNPSTIIQAEARAHRIGQENEVKVRFLLASKTADDVIWKMLINKQNKLGKAGLVANVEDLGANMKTTKFNVKQEKLEKNAAKENQPNKEQTQQVDYFQDDDVDDEEFLKLVENLP